MMNKDMHEALIKLLFEHMAEHLMRGLDYDEALILSVDEIRRQIRGTRLDLESTMINDAVREVRELHGDKLH